MPSMPDSAIATHSTPDMVSTVGGAPPRNENEKSSTMIAENSIVA
jgi:hypothetical protein